MQDRAATESGVFLQEITASTVRAVTDLAVATNQIGYVASNAVSIAQAYFHKEAWFRAIQSKNALVGFVMLRDETLLDPQPLSAGLSLWRFMIDYRFQRSGIGRKALRLIVDHACTRPGINSLQASYVAGPNSPINFYLSFGFVHTGEIKPNGEICLKLDLI